MARLTHDVGTAFIVGVLLGPDLSAAHPRQSMDAQDDVRGLRGEDLTVDAITAVMFEPVGCLAEFRAEEFDVALRGAVRLGCRRLPTSGSQAYWRLLGLLDQAGGTLPRPSLARLEELELAAVERAELYEDVAARAAKSSRSTGVSALPGLVALAPRRRALHRAFRPCRPVCRLGRARGGAGRHGPAAAPCHRWRARSSPRRIIYLVDTADSARHDQGSSASRRC